jgi:hypothetical protein
MLRVVAEAVPDLPDSIADALAVPVPAETATVEGGGIRTHPVETVAAILRALSG